MEISDSSAGEERQIRIANETEDWCRRGESNPRPRDYETLALPLSYAGMRQFFMLRIRSRRVKELCPARSRPERSPELLTTSPIKRCRTGWSKSGQITPTTESSETQG